MKVERDIPGTSVFNGIWYKTLRLNIMKRYVELCARNGTKLSDQAPEMTMKDLRALSEILLSRDTPKSISNRSLLIFQWQALGRISEISAMKWADIGVRKTPHVQALKVNLNRYVNSLLSTIYDEVSKSSTHLKLTPNMRSHSGRSGPTTTASEHPQMQVYK